MMNIKALLLSLAFAVLPFQAATNYKVMGRYPIPGVGGFDYVMLDSSTRRIYVSHAIQVDVLDADTGKVVGTIPDTPGVHGVAIASSFKHGFTSNGRENKVSMFDPSTLQLIKKIDVGKGPDGIYYDPGSKRVFTNNHGSHDITALDAATGEVVGTVKLGGDGEQAIIGAGVDYAAFDPGAGLIFFSCADGTLSIYREKTADVYSDAGAVKTQPSAKTMAFDPKTKKIFLPAAEILEGPPAQPGGRPTRTQKPGTFVVLVVGKS